MRRTAIWVGFFAAMFGGAGLLVSGTEWGLWVGLVLLGLPMAVLVFLVLAHYAGQRPN